MPLSVVQFAVAINDIRYENLDSTADGQMLYKSSITMASTGWESHDICIPDGHSARYIYAYLLEVRASINDPIYYVIEIGAYTPFTFGKAWFDIIDRYIQNVFKKWTKWVREFIMYNSMYCFEDWYEWAMRLFVSKNDFFPYILFTGTYRATHI